MQRPLSGRQNDLFHYASENGYRFNPEFDWDVQFFEQFALFEFHLLEYTGNRLIGKFENGYPWEIVDMTYTDGILMARQEHHITIMVVHLPKPTKDFVITKEEIRQLKNLVRKNKAEKVEPAFITPLIPLLEDKASYYLENINNELLVYRKERFLSTKEVREMHDFVEKLCVLLQSQ